MMVGLGLVVACGDNLRPADNDIGGPYVLLDFTRPTLFSAPVPAWDLTTEELAGIANPLDSAMVEQARDLLANTRGFSRAGGVFFQISEPLNTDELPGIADTVGADSARQPGSVRARGDPVPARGLVQLHPTACTRAP